METRLPIVNDVLWMIMLKLSPEDLGRTCRTNRQLRGICQDKKFRAEYDKVWHFELRDRYMNNPSRGLWRAAQYGYEDLFDYFIKRGGNAAYILSGFAQAGNVEGLEKQTEEMKRENSSFDMTNVQNFIAYYIHKGLRFNPDYESIQRIRNKYPYVNQVTLDPLIGDANAIRNYLEKATPADKEQMLLDMRSGFEYMNLEDIYDYRKLLEEYKIYDTMSSYYKSWYRNQHPYEATALKYLIDKDWEKLDAYLSINEEKEYIFRTVKNMMYEYLDFPLEAVKILRKHYPVNMLMLADLTDQDTIDFLNKTQGDPNYPNKLY
jgi:hypothetical protein